MQATCQSAFPFAGIDRRPGDVLTAEDLALTSRTVIDAMRGQGLILLDGDISGGQGQGPDYGLLLAKYEALEARIGRMEQTHVEEVDALKAALSGAVDAAVMKAVEAFTGPAETVDSVIDADLRSFADNVPVRQKPGPKPKGGL